ncbi:MAG: hypothetical protein GY823_01870 [Flavobacteriaceae bacterium]|nr:hypothetical protein [Flavobacteriaceae bacterium]
MLTNFFSNSKPFHFILISLLLFVGYTFHNFQISSFENDFIWLIQLTFKFGLYIILMLIFGFIIKKNNLTQINSYALFIFVCLLLLTPNVFQNSKPILSTVFILLALRRILSFNSKKNIQKKILDASLWIGIATLFYFWSILFLLVLYAALIQLASKNFKLFLIPIIGMFVVFIICTIYFLYLDNNMYWFTDYENFISFDFSSYKLLKNFFSLFVILSMIVISLVFKFLNFTKTPLRKKSKYWIIIFTLITGIIIVILTAQKNGIELIFTIVPISILFSNFIEALQRKWVSEVMLWFILIAPIFSYFF